MAIALKCPLTSSLQRSSGKSLARIAMKFAVTKSCISLMSMVIQSVGCQSRIQRADANSFPSMRKCICTGTVQISGVGCVIIFHGSQLEGHLSIQVSDSPICCSMISDEGIYGNWYLPISIKSGFYTYRHSSTGCPSLVIYYLMFGPYESCNA